MSGVIYYWRAGSSYRQADETFSRSGTRYAFNHKTGLYEEVASGVPRTSSWVKATDGEWYRTLELALGDTPVTDDSARFSSSSGWTRNNVGSEASKTSIFATLPTNGEARQLVGNGSLGNIRQVTGTHTGSKEISLMVAENDGSDPRVALRSLNDFDLVVSYDFATDTVNEQTGTPDASGRTILTESGQNGGRTVLFWVVFTKTAGTNKNLLYYFDHRGASEGAIFHYAAHHDLGFFPGPDPQVGTASSFSGDQFSVSPGPYRSDVAQAWYVEFIAGTLIGDTGSNFRIIEHGDGSNPMVRLQESSGTAGQIEFDYLDTDGNSSQRTVDIGTSDPLQRIEAVYVIDPSDGNNRLLARADGGTVQDSGASSPSSWTTPTGLGSSDQIAYNETGDINGTARGRNHFRRHLSVLGPDLDNDPLTGTASAVMDEMAALATLND